MMKKLLSVFLMLVLSLTCLTMVNGNDDEIEFVDVDVDGTDVNRGDVLTVKRGENLRVRVELISSVPFDDVKYSAEIQGYEWKDVKAVSPMFNMVSGSKYVMDLTLNVPNDIPASEEYKLRLRAYNQDFEINEDYTLRIEADRYSVDIKDVLFTPGDLNGNVNLKVGQPLFTTVVVENMGYKEEKMIKVSVAVPQLGAYQSTYIKELSAIEDDDENDEETSDISKTIYLPLKNSLAGTYDLIVKVEYADGHEEVTENYQLVIDGVSAGAQDVLVDATETSKSANVGEGIVYSISIANMRSNAGTFTAEVSGLDWANFKVDPILTTVQAGSSGEMFVYISPNEGVTGQNAFTVTVKEGNSIVKQINFQANINDSNWGSVLTGLEIGFVVLLIILVILGIVLAATRMGKKDDEEPLGETYY